MQQVLFIQYAKVSQQLDNKICKKTAVSTTDVLFVHSFSCSAVPQALLHSSVVLGCKVLNCCTATL